MSGRRPRWPGAAARLSLLAPWLLLLAGWGLSRARVGVPGAPIFAGGYTAASWDLAFDGRGRLHVSRRSCIWRLERWKRLVPAVDGRGGQRRRGRVGIPDSALTYGGSLAFDRRGRMYLAAERRVWRVAGNRAALLAEVPGDEWVPPVAVDEGGNVFLACYSSNRVLKIGTEGRLVPVAGTGRRGSEGDGGPATAALLSGPEGVAALGGELWIADSGNHRIRKVDRQGIISTVVGTGRPGYSGDGGPALAARLSWPSALALGPDGSLYIADVQNRCVRKVDRRGIISTVAGGGTQRFPAEGARATEAALGFVIAVAVDGVGDVYLTDGWGDSAWVRRVDRRGRMQTVLSNFFGRPGVAW